jgi:MFS family permease
MHFSGRLTDRIGGGVVVLCGLAVLSLGTLPFTQVGASTPYWTLAVALAVRGVGLGFTMMPAMASAYVLLQRHQVPRATPILNVLQRVGGSIGVAVLAVVLERQLRGAHGATQVATAFAHTYWWSLALVLVAIIPATLLALEQRKIRTRDRAAKPPPEGVAAVAGG